MSVTPRKAPGEPRTINETNCRQAWRLLEAGCSGIKVGMVANKIFIDPVPLGQLWDTAHRLGIKMELSTELNTTEMIEALVVAIEDHLRNQQQ